MGKIFSFWIYKMFLRNLKRKIPDLELNQLTCATSSFQGWMQIYECLNLDWNILSNHEWIIEKGARDESWSTRAWTQVTFKMYVDNSGERGRYFFKLKSISTYERQMIPFNDDFRDVLPTGNSSLARGEVTRPQIPRAEKTTSNKGFESRTHLEQCVVSRKLLERKREKEVWRNCERSCGNAIFGCDSDTCGKPNIQNAPGHFEERSWQQTLTHANSVPHHKEKKEKKENEIEIQRRKEQVWRTRIKKEKIKTYQAR